MFSYKAKIALKVYYMSNRPHEWGYKLFVLRGTSGCDYNCKLFNCQKNNAEDV